MRLPGQSRLAAWARDRWTWWDEAAQAPGRWCTVPEALHAELVRLCYWLWDVEWDERRTAWPHCCTQAGCWMHYRPGTRWCGCRCRWCAVARLARREGKPPA